MCEGGFLCDTRDKGEQRNAGDCSWRRAGGKATRSMLTRLHKNKGLIREFKRMEKRVSWRAKVAEGDNAVLDDYHSTFGDDRLGHGLGLDQARKEERRGFREGIEKNNRGKKAAGGKRPLLGVTLGERAPENRGGNGAVSRQKVIRHHLSTCGPIELRGEGRKTSTSPSDLG